MISVTSCIPTTAVASSGGPDYREFHLAAWREAARVLVPGGRFVLNIKDHLRAGRRQHVAGWHVTVLCRLGLRLLDAIEVETPGMRSGANGQSRMPAEMVFVFEREASELREPDGVEAH